MDVSEREVYPWDEVYYSDELYETQLRTRLMVPLFACESGSRAWGFASKDSDYDVRFVYCRPKSYYLSLNPRPDNVNLTLELKSGDKVDVVGWDIKKFLQLVAKSNAMPFEWIFACPKYYAEPAWLAAIEPVMFEHMDVVKLAHHYRGMATKHWRRYIEGREEVTHKKYLYILRAIWNLEWYATENASIAPVDLNMLLLGSNIPDDVKEETFKMIQKKIAGNELGLARPNFILDAYIADRVYHWQDGFEITSSTQVSWELLNDAFKETLALAERY